MYKVGDYVVRKSYGKDILFRIIYISATGIAKLIGISFRIAADAPLSDLERAEGMRYTAREDSTMTQIEQNIKEIIKKRGDTPKSKMRMFEKPGKVLHVDGDPFYLKLCMKYYEKLGIEAIGEHVPEPEQPRRIKGLIEKYSPSILVVTGHDALNKNYNDVTDLNEYKNSKYYVETVKQARSICPSSGQLFIFAGACQSDFEALLDAGADFAASPSRVLIHALDPVFVVEKIAYSPFHQVLGIEDVLKYTITGLKGLGGYETKGKCKRGGPVVLREEKEQDEARELEKIGEEILNKQIEQVLEQPIEDKYIDENPTLERLSQVKSVKYEAPKGPFIWRF